MMDDLDDFIDFSLAEESWKSWDFEEDATSTKKDSFIVI